MNCCFPIWRKVCKKYVPSTTRTRLHVKVMYSTSSSSMQKPKSKRKNTLPLISWTIKKDVKALTNKQLKMYLNQKGLKISGSKAELIDRVLTHARGNLSVRCCRWGISQFMRRRHKLRVQWFWRLFKWLFDTRRRVIWSDVCTGGRTPTSKLGMRESMWGNFFQEGGGDG